MFITGGASGLGKAIALAWASQNAKGIRICVADIQEPKAAEAITELEALGAEAYFQHCDITSQSSVDSAVATIRDKWGGVDVVINNAGVATGGSLTGESQEQWQWVFNINLFSMVRVCQAFAPMLKQQGSGYFINISSQAGLTPIPYMNSYNAVKSAVIALSETMRLELVSDGVDVSVVCPGFFKTGLGDSMRTSEPGLKKLMHKAFENAELDAEQVAAEIVRQAQQRKFLIQTHSIGKKAYLMKRFLPLERYLRYMSKKTKHLKKYTQ